MISLLPALLIALGGIALGAALGWLASVGVRDATGLPRPQAEVRMAALEAENLSLVSALSRARLQIEALETQLPAAEALGQQNMALQQTVADLRAVLAGVPLPEEGEARTLLAAARAERDAAQRALMRQVAEEAARKVMQDPPDRDRGVIDLTVHPRPVGIGWLDARFSTLLAPFQIKLDAILAAVERVRDSAVARNSEEMMGDLETIANATAELHRRVLRVAEGNPDGWSASQIRHDLRTPLNHIIGYGEILLQEAEDLGATTVLTDLSRVVRGGKEILSDIDELARDLSEPGRPVAPTPIAIPRSRMPSPGAHVAGASKIQGRILVVDDNVANRELLTRLLRRGGHVVAEASDGVEALDELESRRFDLVLLDLQMPRLDGTGVLSVMKQDNYLRHIPVIMISGLDELPKIVECIQLGADDYLPKPFDQVLLQARIGACLEKKQLRDRAVDHLEQIELEKRRANGLLRVILPDAIVAELQETDNVKPRRYEGVAVLFCDIVGFTAFSESREPEEVLANLQKLVEAYEGLMGKHHMQKIKTIGDSFMAVAGLLDPVENPVLQCARCGRDMIKLAAQLPTAWGVRVGIAYGPVVAGVLGRQQYQFDLWGDTVNTAARVESLGHENGVSLSAEAWSCIDGEPGVRGKGLGSVQMKGKGLVPLYHLHEVDGEKIGLR